MSNRRSRHSNSTRISEEQMNELLSKLQMILPEAPIRRNSRVSAAKVLQETCSYIKNLNREVEDLSERLSELLVSTNADTAQAAMLRSLLMQ
ncbi:hypothetical protein LUZ60_004573 [Juncus effusus]|nr:hypothetical protein LUZ60_004573 [Juncus effusus]